MTATQIERLISRLPRAQQVALGQRLTARTWRDRFNRVVARLRRDVGRWSDTEITRLVEDVRRTRYAAAGGGPTRG